MRRLFPLVALMPLTLHAHPGHELLSHGGALLFAAGLIVGVLAAPMLLRTLRERRDHRD